MSVLMHLLHTGLSFTFLFHLVFLLIYLVLVEIINQLWPIYDLVHASLFFWSEFIINLCLTFQFDFTGCGTYLFVMGMVLLIFGIVSIFWRNEVVNMLYSAGIALLFSMVSAFLHFCRSCSF